MNIPFKINQENLHGTRPRPFLPFGVSSPSGKTRQIDQSFSPSSHQSPLSGADREREYLINTQIRKLGDMRKAQIDFFDSKMTQLKEAEESTARRSQELRELQTSLQQKEAHVRNQLRRLEVEKAEIMAIRDLLRAEHESITVTSSDLKSQLKKYEKILKLQGPPTLLTIKKVGNHKT